MLPRITAQKAWIRFTSTEGLDTGFMLLAVRSYGAVCPVVHKQQKSKTNSRDHIEEDDTG
jgi:hypothetical protein